MKRISRNIGYLPVVGESLEQYSTRLESIIQQLESWSLGHVGWHTHKSAGECWICELTNCGRYIVGILQDISRTAGYVCDESRVGMDGQYTLTFRKSRTKRQVKDETK